MALPCTSWPTSCLQASCVPSGLSQTNGIGARIAISAPVLLKRGDEGGASIKIKWHLLHASHRTLPRFGMKFVTKVTRPQTCRLASTFALHLQRQAPHQRLRVL